MAMLRFFPILLLIPAIFAQSSSPAPGVCCQKKTVSAVADDLNGVYIFKRGGGDSVDQDCYAGCVYKKEGAPDSNEYCFKAVTQGAATITDEECEAVSSSTGPTGPSSTGPTGPSSTGPTGPSSTGPSGPSSTGPSSTGPSGPSSTGPTGPQSTISSTSGSTLNPVATIDAANEAIEKANADHAEATANSNTASSASSAVDDIQAKLTSASTSTTAGQRIKRQASSTTVGPVTTCDDFSGKYNQLLDELKILSDTNIGLIQQLVTVLNDVLVIPCTATQQSALQTSTSAKVVAAKEKATEYKAEKEDEKKALVKIVEDATKQIAEANQQLLAEGSTTIPPVTPSFTTQQTTGGSSGPQTSPGGSSGPQTSPGGSSEPQTSPGGSSGPQTSPGGSSEPQTSPGGSSTPTMTTNMPGRRLNKFRIFN